MKTTEKSENIKGNDSLSGKKDEPLTRDQVLRLSSQTIRQLHRRVSGQVRFKEQSGDRARLAMIRALSQLLQTYSSLLRDNELVELECRISDLEQQKECRCNS